VVNVVLKKKGEPDPMDKGSWGIKRPSKACGIYAENLLAVNGARGVCYCGYKESEHITQD